MKVVSGKLERPDRSALVGTAGVGKTTFLASTRKPIVITTEEGANELDISRAFMDDGSLPDSYEDVLKLIDDLTNDAQGFETLGIDTLDWLIMMMERYIIKDRKTKDGEPYTSIEDFGFGKGYVVLAEEARIFLSKLEKLQAKQRMDVLFLVHAAVKKVNPPDSEPYDRYGMKLHDKVAALIMEWCSNVYLAQINVAVKKGDKRQGERNKAFGETDDRVLRTCETAAYQAKNRIGLEPTIPFNTETYATIQAARKRCLTSTDDLLKQVEALFEGHEFKDKALAYFKSQPNKQVALAQLKRRLETVQETASA